jgi:hypothetical protein
MAWPALVYASCFRPQIGTEVTGFLAGNTTAAAAEPGPVAVTGTVRPPLETTSAGHCRPAEAARQFAAGPYELNH